jgi:hypothetical protein
MGWSALLFLLVWLLAPALGEYFNLAVGTTLFRVAAVSIPVMAFFYLYEAVLNGRRRFGALSWLQ